MHTRAPASRLILRCSRSSASKDASREVSRKSACAAAAHAWRREKRRRRCGAWRYMACAVQCLRNAVHRPPDIPGSPIISAALHNALTLRAPPRSGCLLAFPVGGSMLRPAGACCKPTLSSQATGCLPGSASAWGRGNAATREHPASRRMPKEPLARRRAPHLFYSSQSPQPSS